MRETKFAWLIPAGLIIVSMLMALFHFDSAFIFHGDHERDLRLATVMVTEGVWPNQSPSISPLPFELGPLLYVILAPAIAISPNPLWVHVYFLCLAAIGFWVFHSMLSQRISRAASAIALFALIASTFNFEMSRQLWHSSLLPLPVALFLWASHKLLDNSSEKPTLMASIAGICAAIAIQLHLTASIYVVLFAGLVIWKAKILKLRGFMTSSAAFVITLLPMITTFVRAVQQGALNRLSGGADHWSPASAWDTVDFFIKNIEPIWGDNIGPLFLWPLLTLCLVGVTKAIVTGSAFQRFLVINLITGFIIESLLLGNQQAHRYMHANMYSAFALTGIGAHWLLSHLERKRLINGVLTLIAAVLTIEAALSPVPHSMTNSWLNANEQNAVAKTIVTHYPLPTDSMETRIHGIYFGEQMGMQQWHHTHAPDDIEAAFSDSEHIVVIPSDLEISPFNRAISSERKIQGHGRTIRVIAYEPAIDYKAITYSSPTAAALKQKWRRPRASRISSMTHVIEVPTLKAGALHVVVSGDRSKRDYCSVQAKFGRHPLKARSKALKNYQGVTMTYIPVPGRGQITITVGPCQRLRYFDVF